MKCGPGARSSVRRKPRNEGQSGVGPATGAGQPREVYFELYPVGDSMKVSAVDAATGIEVSIVGPANLPKSELEQVALNKLFYVMKQKGKMGPKESGASKASTDGKGWVV